MSNSVSNADVEDVLESIRRLVSEHKKPSEAAQEDSARSDGVLELQQKDRLPNDDDKLLLTPSHRVASEDASDPEQPEWMVPDSAWGEEMPEPEDTAAAPFVLQEVHKEEPGADDHATPDADSTEEQPDLIADALAAEAQFDEMVEPEPEDHSAPTIALFDRDAAEDSHSDDSLTEVDAEIEPVAELEVPAEPEAEMSNATIDDADTTSEDETVAEFGTVRQVPKEGDLAADAGAGDPDTTEGAAVPEEAVTAADPFTKDEVSRIENRAARQMKLGAKIAALEAVIGRRDDQWEPDGVDEDAYSGTAQQPIEWEDAEIDEAEDVAEPQGEPETIDAHVADIAATPVTVFHRHNRDLADLENLPAAEEDAAGTGELDLDIDEDALRVLVSDIVREELQGPLGERITRNVRKLVRREIHRAMASKEFE